MRVFGIIVKSTTLGQHGFELCQCMYACIFPVNIELAFYSLRFPISSFNKQQIRMFICCWQNPWKWDLGYRGPTMGLKHHWILVYSGAPVQGILKILLPQHSSKASILQHSAFFMIQLSHPCMTTGKTIALTWWTFVSNVMSLLFNMLSRIDIAFLPVYQPQKAPIHWLKKTVVYRLDLGSRWTLQLRSRTDQFTGESHSKSNRGWIACVCVWVAEGGGK